MYLASGLRSRKLSSDQSSFQRCRTDRSTSPAREARKPKHPPNNKIISGQIDRQQSPSCNRRLPRQRIQSSTTIKKLKKGTRNKAGDLVNQTSPVAIVAKAKSGYYKHLHNLPLIARGRPYNARSGRSVSDLMVI